MVVVVVAVVVLVDDVDVVVVAVDVVCGGHVGRSLHVQIEAACEQ
jgi:hypothetical protein